MSLFSKTDYSGALQNLLPQGRAWPRESTTVQAAVIRALARSFARSDDDAQRLLVGAFPSAATILLTEWENTLGLPDDCAIGEIGGISDRQLAVVSKLISTGGLSRQYYIQVAAALGYTITISQFRPAMSGMTVCGDALNGDEWPFTWRINSPLTTMKYAVAGGAYCTDPLASWGNKQLECAITKIAPSHLRLIFNYE
ncbi:YmfQ family protein [Symbiopectobacterium purcellii]|uniref:DUF2313 domain-containing protein n=1 Tax=Symbiopectobacterium purcellii TaxID=2871826 RepID=A0ABX9AQD9_9ENTR|nr:putative phage tail protein [Symbiopectobacterium purcellii]QZN97363.1 DUF2313 domain-containing protein [Symbiopectobacterium purcellii]